jgi:hypothetical protein
MGEKAQALAFSAAAVAAQGLGGLVKPALRAIAVEDAEELARRLDLFDDDEYCPSEKAALQACVDATCPDEEFSDDPTDWTEASGRRAEAFGGCALFTRGPRRASRGARPRRASGRPRPGESAGEQMLPRGNSYASAGPRAQADR